MRDLIAKLAQDRRHVTFYSAFADIQFVCNFPIGLSRNYEIRNFALALR